jgi:hypothetical protein
MKVKDTLKALQGSYNKFLQGWIFQAHRREQVVRVLSADATNTVEEHTTATIKADKRRNNADDEFIDDDESD